MTETGTTKSYDGFTEDERAAMKERAQELKKTKKASKPDGESDVLEKIAEMPPADKAIAQ